MNYNTIEKHYNIYGIKVKLITTKKYEFLEQLDTEYGYFECNIDESIKDLIFRVEEEKFLDEGMLTKCGNSLLINENIFFYNGQQINHPYFYINDFRPYFTNAIYYHLMKSKQYFLLHSAAYSYKKIGCLLLGDSGCGKSSLTLMHVLSGGFFLSNDIAYVGVENGVINILGLPQVMNLGDEALEWFNKEMNNEFLRCCILENQKKYNKKPKQCVRINKERIAQLIVPLKLVVFPEKDFKASEPWYETIENDCAYIKFISYIRTIDKEGFRKSASISEHLENLKKLVSDLQTGIKFICFHWGKDHKKNFEVLQRLYKEIENVDKLDL